MTSEDEDNEEEDEEGEDDIPSVEGGIVCMSPEEEEEAASIHARTAARRGGICLESVSFANFFLYFFYLLLYNLGIHSNDCSPPSRPSPSSPGQTEHAVMVPLRGQFIFFLFIVDNCFR